ncbi:MAG: hypothetical protein Q4A18_02240 [Rikenellaceae bacterium]|nr:hypothetical protein [Rikenellaceae bacterium]
MITICKRILISAILLVVSAGVAEAQSLGAFKQQLAREVVTPEAPEGARVEVAEMGSAADAVEALSNHNNAPARIRGYRVCIFFDNGQDARAGAMEAKTLFQEHYPDVKLYMVYENPYFRVTVGNCLTIEEAIILKGRLATYFPKAFPKSEELALSDLLE